MANYTQKYTPLQQGMKGIVVANVTNTNFAKIWEELNRLKAENEELKRTAMIGNNGTGGITNDAVVNVMYNPQTIIAKTEYEDCDYYVDVKVMCGQQELKVGTDSPAKFTFEASCDNNISEAGIVANVAIVDTDDDRLRLKVTVKPGAISDGSFDFYVKYNNITYNYTVTVVVINSDSGIEYAQGVFMSTIFTRSDGQPERPTGGDFNIPLPTTLSNGLGIMHQGWTDGIPSGTKPLWTSHRKFTNNGKSPQDETWSEPILAMDSSDLDVCFTSGTTNGDVPQEPLQHGDQDAYEDPSGWHNIGNEFDVWMATSVKNGNEWGPWSIIKVKGEDGSMSDWKDTIYKESSTQPATPTANDPDDFVDNPSAEAPNDGWHDMPNDNGTWWMSCAYVNGDTGKVDEWSIPVMVAGGTGQGVFVSNVFTRSFDKPFQPTGGDYGTPIPDGGDWSDGIPNGNGNAAPVWTSHRTFTSDGMSPQTDTWSEPILMVDSADFDCCFSSYEGIPEAPQRHGDQSSYTDPYGWHNEGTSDDIWMATSSKPANSTQWGKWVVTKIKGESGVDGNYTSYIFKSASGTSIDAPTVTIPEYFVDKADNELRYDTGTSIQPGDDAYERNRGWKDGPGIDYENDGLTWWMSCGVIDGSTGRVMQDGWSKPIPMDGRDGASTEYRYGINDSEVDPPRMDQIDDDTVWSDTVAGALHNQSVKDGVTPDYATVPSNHYMWMAMRRSILVEGVLTPQSWEYCRVTGEKGESGTQLKVKDTKESYEELFLIAVNSNNTPRATLPEDGDTYVVNKDMWVWSDAADWVHADNTTRSKYSTNLDPAKWKNCGPIVGPSGATPFFHVKYAKALTLSAETENHEIIWYPNEAFNSADGCRYLGTRVDIQKEALDGPQYYSGYTWAQFTGEDGYGYEYIYRLSATNPAQFTVPTQEQCTPYNGKNFEDNDYVPSGWTDNPTGISTLYPYEFMASRVRENGVWKPFKGQPSSNVTPILYSYRGKDAPYEERQWHAFQSMVLTDAMKNATDWQTTIPNANAYQHDYIWQRTRTVTPAYGSQTADTRTEWEYLRVSGEKGNVGTGIQLNGTCKSLDELFRLAYDNPQAGTGYRENKISGGTAYTVSGDLWVWNEANDDILSANTDEHGSHVDYGTNIPCHHWRNGGQIKGEASHIHIKYAKVASAVTESVSGVQVTKYYVLDNDWLTTKITPGDGELPGKYIGICYNNTEDDPDPIPEGGGLVSPYSWTLFQGEDGLDYEMIYTRTSGNTAPAVPNITGNLLSGNTTAVVADEDRGFNADGSPKYYTTKYYSDADFVPCYKKNDNNKTTRGDNGQPVTTCNWTDNPMGTTEALPYEWAAKRDKVNGVWTDFYGRADKTNECVLYNKYGRSSMEINIPTGQYIYYPIGSDGYANQVDKVIEFVISKDGEILNADRIEFSDVSITNDGNPSTSGMSNYFSTYSGYTTGGSNDCANPHIHLINKRFKLNDQYQYSFTCTLTIGGQEYKKTFYFQLEPKGEKGKDGENIVEYTIVPDKTSLKMTSAGSLDMGTNDGISIECFVKSGDTVTKIAFGSIDGNKYGLTYKVDSLEEATIYRDSRTSGGDMSNGFIPKSSIQNVTKQVTLYLRNNGNAVQAITIPTVYDGQGGSRTNLFGKENPIKFSGGNKVVSQIMHTDTGFAAIIEVTNIAFLSANIGDNPFEPCLVSGDTYMLTYQIRFRNISNCPTIKYFPEDVGIGPESASVVLSGDDFSGWYSASRRIDRYVPGSVSDVSEYNRIRLKIGNLQGSNQTWKIAMEVRKLKLEHLPNTSMPATEFDGLAVGHAIQNNNILQGSGVFKAPFVKPTSNRLVTNVIPYGYCGNHVFTVYERINSDITAILKYTTRISKGKYYTVSWYQKAQYSGSTSPGYIRFSLKGTDWSLLPVTMVVCSEDGAMFKTNVNNQIIDTTHDLTGEWKRHSMTFYSSGDESSSDEFELRWYFYPNGHYTTSDRSTAYIAMPKLEESDYATGWCPNEADRMGKPLRGPRNWEAGEVYQGGGVEDDFQDIVMHTNQNVMYLCKVTHTASNDNNPSNGTTTNGWTTSMPWAVTQKVDFIASDVIWSESFMTHMMKVVKGKVEELVINKLNTESTNGGATIKIENGVMEAFGRNGNKNLEIGVDDQGRAVLKFFDINGNYQYNLGPQDITSKIKKEPAYYSLTDYVRIMDNSIFRQGPDAPMCFYFNDNYNNWVGTNGYLMLNRTNVYQFHDGYISQGNVMKFTTRLSVSESGDTEFNLESHSTYHERFFSSSGSTGALEPSTGNYLGPIDNGQQSWVGICTASFAPIYPNVGVGWSQYSSLLFLTNGIVEFTMKLYFNNYNENKAYENSTLHAWAKNLAGEWKHISRVAGASVDSWSQIGNKTYRQVAAWMDSSTSWDAFDWEAAKSFRKNT